MGWALEWVWWRILGIPHLWMSGCPSCPTPSSWVPGVAEGGPAAGGGEPPEGAGRGGARRTWAERGRCAGPSLPGAAARANGQRLAARPAPEPQSRPLAAWRRRGRRAEASAGETSCRRRSRRQGMRMAVGSVKMQPPCESPALAAAAAVAAADGALRRSPSAREQEREQPPAPPRPRLRDLPALLRSGLTLRRKRSAAGARVSGPDPPGPSGHGRRARGARAHSPGPQRGHLEVGEGGGRGALLRGPGTAGSRGVRPPPPVSEGFPFPQMHLT